MHGITLKTQTMGGERPVTPLAEVPDIKILFIREVVRSIEAFKQERRETLRPTEPNLYVRYQ